MVSLARGSGLARAGDSSACLIREGGGMTLKILHRPPYADDTERPVPRWAMRLAYALPLLLLPAAWIPLIGGRRVRPMAAVVPG